MKKANLLSYLFTRTLDRNTRILLMAQLNWNWDDIGRIRVHLPLSATFIEPTSINRHYRMFHVGITSTGSITHV